MVDMMSILQVASSVWFTNTRDTKSNTATIHNRFKHHLITRTTHHMPNQQTRGSVLQMINTLDICSTALKNDEASPLLGMAAKALAQLQSHSDRMTAEVVDWQDRYEQMGQLYNELARKSGDLAEENEQLLIKCEQHEVDERSLNDMLVAKIDGLADDNEKLECELASYKTLFEASPMQDTATTVTDISSLSGDVYAQLDAFEDSLDMELEDFQQLVVLDTSSVVAMASSVENEKNTSETNGYKLSMTPSKNSLQAKTLETIKDTPRAPNMYGLELLRGMFQTTQTQRVDDAVPALTTSDSLMSLPSNCSISSRSSSDLLSWKPTKKTMRTSPQRNAEWAIFE